VGKATKATRVAGRREVGNLEKEDRRENTRPIVAGRSAYSPKFWANARDPFSAGDEETKKRGSVSSCFVQTGAKEVDSTPQ